MQGIGHGLGLDASEADSWSLVAELGWLLTPIPEQLDGLGMGIGFTAALLFIGVVREVLGSGSIFGIALFPDSFQAWTVMVLPSGGFFAMALWLLIVNRIREKQEAREKELAKVSS